MVPMEFEKQQIARRAAKRAAGRAWWVDNGDQTRAARRAQHAENPETNRRRGRAYYAANRSNVLAKGRARHAADRLRCLHHYSDGTMKCCCCGEGTEQFLTIDHIDGKRAMGHSRSMNGTPLRRWLIKNEFPQGFQVLCYNCNCAKGFYGQCPHQSTSTTDREEP